MWTATVSTLGAQTLKRLPLPSGAGFAPRSNCHEVTSTSPTLARNHLRALPAPLRSSVPINQVHDLLLLVLLEPQAATTDTTLVTCRIQTNVRVFAQHRTLELRKGSYNLQSWGHLARWYRSLLSDYGTLRQPVQFSPSGSTRL